MTQLELLKLGENRIRDIAPLEGLKNLAQLDLVNNRVEDVRPLRNLIELKSLDLGMNRVSDIAPLAANPGLGDGDLLNLSGNPLDETATEVHIPALIERGVHVVW
jgi:Leucine-rich repeat (LRR) protein